LPIGQFENARIQSIIIVPKGAKISRPNTPLYPAFEKIRHHRNSLNKNNGTAKRKTDSTIKIAINGAAITPGPPQQSIFISSQKNSNQRPIKS
jgi:hypothetical protein